MSDPHVRKPYVFISYRRDPIASKVARKVALKFAPMLRSYGGAVFWDQAAIDSGAVWREELQQALDKTTHFVVLLTDEYWEESAVCKQELLHAVGRWEADPASIRILCVQVETMAPHYLTFDTDRQSGQLKSDNPRLQALGDLNFLGPFEPVSGRLERMKTESGHEQAMSDQVAAMAARLEGLLKKGL